MPRVTDKEEFMVLYIVDRAEDHGPRPRRITATKFVRPDYESERKFVVFDEKLLIKDSWDAMQCVGPYMHFATPDEREAVLNTVFVDWVADRLEKDATNIEQLESLSGRSEQPNVKRGLEHHRSHLRTEERTMLIEEEVF